MLLDGALINHPVLSVVRGKNTYCVCKRFAKSKNKIARQLKQGIIGGNELNEIDCVCSYGAHAMVDI